MSVMQIHNLIHGALLVAGNVIWLQPGQVHMTPTLYNLKHFMNVHLPFSVLQFYFSNLFCFTLLLGRRPICMYMYTVFYGRVHFLSRAVLFDCGLTNWSCMSRSVKGDNLVCMVSTFKLVPCNLQCMFC